MPTIQAAPPRDDPSPIANILGAFANRTRQNQVAQKESDELGKIIEQYKQDGDLLNAAMNANRNPNLSPTTRVNTANQLLQFGKINQQKQKDVQKKLEEHEQISRERNSLREAGATDEQIKLYEASPVGGKTKIVEDILEQKNRSKIPAGLDSPDIIDYDLGLTPKERVKRQDQRFSVQTPLVTKNSDSLTGLESENRSLELLEELDKSGKVGQGVHKLNINPKTGDLIIPQFASAEEQLFVKTVNDFTVKAKDSFGARVTNFELDRFMQRLPTLANSSEGRRLIIRQMKIINNINQLEKKAIQQVFDQYGVRNIDYVDAENKARNSIKDQKEELRKEYLDLEQLAKKEDKLMIENIRKKVPEGHTAMRTPEGKIKYFPNKNIPNLLEKPGYEKI